LNIRDESYSNIDIHSNSLPKLQNIRKEMRSSNKKIKMSPLVTLEELQKNYTDYNKDIIDNSEIIDKLLQESRINYTYDS